jgi:O-antigen ligase
MTISLALPRVRARLTVLERLFVLAAVVAPIDLLLGGSFTVYDFLLLVVFAGVLLSGRPLVMPRFMAVPVLVFIGAALVSTVRSPQPLESLEQIMQFVFIFFVQIPVTLAIARNRRVIHATVIALIVGSLLGLSVSLAIGHAGGAGRIVAFFSDNPNRLGYPTSYLLPFVVYYARRAWRSGWKVLTILIGGFVSYVFIWALAASASRSASLALMVTLLVLVTRPPLVLRRTITSLVIVATAMTALWFAVNSSGVLPATLSERIDRTLGGDEDLVSDRSRLARAGIDSFMASPFVGTGLDNFRFVATDFLSTATDQLPHNLWIQFLAQIGLIGTVAFALLILRWFINLFRMYLHEVKESDHEMLGWAFIASMASVMTIFLFVPLMIHRHYWLLFALGAALVRLRADEEGL